MKSMVSLHPFCCPLKGTTGKRKKGRYRKEATQKQYTFGIEDVHGKLNTNGQMGQCKLQYLKNSIQSLQTQQTKGQTLLQLSALQVFC